MAGKRRAIAIAISVRRARLGAAETRGSITAIGRARIAVIAAHLSRDVTQSGHAGLWRAEVCDVVVCVGDAGFRWVDRFIGAERRSRAAPSDQSEEQQKE